MSTRKNTPQLSHFTDINLNDDYYFDILNNNESFKNKSHVWYFGDWSRS